MKDMENFYPSNGTEGMIFIDQFCEKCYKYKQCTILTNSMLGKEPKQWVYKDGEPTCTSFNPNRPKRKKFEPTNQWQEEMFKGFDPDNPNLR